MADKNSLLDAIRSMITISKDIPKEDMEGLEDVMDQWQGPEAMHKVPTKEEIKVGNSESASGEGAFVMVDRYSHPSKQTVGVINYDKFSRYLEGMTSAVKANSEQIKTIASFLAAKAEAPTATAVTESFLAKAENRLKSAALALRKADMADDDEKEEKEDSLEKAERALAHAKKMLAKAEDENEDKMDENVAEGCEKAASMLKSLSRKLAKAKAELPTPAVATVAAPVVAVKAEDEKKEEKEEKVEKAATLDPNRIEILEKTVSDLMDTVSGRSKHAPLPDFAKSVAAVDTFAERISEAEQDEAFQPEDLMKARDLYSRVAAARSGAYDWNHVQSQINAASDKVKNLFKIAA